MADLELFSVTVLGGARCGKTSLVNAFVNHACPSVPQETEEPQLYYKTLSIPAPAELNKPPLSVLVEIEDTAAGRSADGAGIEDFLDVHRDGFEDEESTELLGGCRAPQVGMYRPLSRRRMGFLLLFDGSEASLAEALELHGRIKERNGDGPVVCLVANLLCEPSDPLAARRYAEEKGILFFELQGFDLKKVKQLFRAVLIAIYGRPKLWRR
ncbi:unnamed protein product [Effrenium voratum]|nr:unnamed protein product [Effrenium voratum]